MEVLSAALPQIVCGFFIGFLIVYSGVGGGALVIPVMLLLFDTPPSLAIGTASVFATMTKTAAGMQHWRIGNVNVRLCALFASAAIPGVLITSVTVNYYAQAGEESFQQFLRYLIAAAVIVSLAAAQFRPSTTASAPALLLSAGFVVGAVMGATGVGGGVLIVPALLLLSNETPKRVVGASIVIALLLSAVTAVVYAGGGQIDYGLAAWMTVGAMLAVVPATKLLRVSSQKTVKIIVHVLIVIALFLMLWEA